MFAMILLVVNLLAVIVISSDDIKRHRSEGEIKYFVISGIPLFYGVSKFMFEGDYFSLNIEDSMKKPKDMPKIAGLGIFLLSIMFSLLAIFPYIAYKDQVDEIVYDSFVDSPATTYLNISYPLAAFLSIPITVYPIPEIIYRSNVLDRCHKIFTEKPIYKFYLATVVFIAV